MYKRQTVTGRLVYPIVDKFIVQWEEQKKVYPKAINLGDVYKRQVREMLGVFLCSTCGQFERA